MFRRREKQSWLRHLREFVWPSAGFRRSTRYLVHRIGRLPGTPTSIAVGFACGAAVAFTPFVGFHLAIALIFAWLVRGNPWAAGIGTLLANPWSVPVILYGIYHIGAWMLRESSQHHLPRDVGSLYILRHPLEVLLPMTLGSLPIVVAVWFISFFAARQLVTGYHRRRQQRTGMRQDKRRRDKEET
jgi:uncharacterized protein (DUF2062 family)